MAWFSATRYEIKTAIWQEIHSFDWIFLLWQKRTYFDKNIKWKSLLYQSYERKLLKIWQSAWLFINISCDISNLRWNILPTVPVNIPPWVRLQPKITVHIVPTLLLKKISNRRWPRFFITKTVITFKWKKQFSNWKRLKFV